MKILIVEDEDILAKVLQEKLEDDNFKVSVAYDGVSALSMIKNLKPDMVLLDLLLPKMSGLEVLASIKKDDDLSNIPVIILSNLSNDPEVKKALSMGAVDYMVKTKHPINEVIEKVNKYILKAR